MPNRGVLKKLEILQPGVDIEHMMRILCISAKMRSSTDYKQIVPVILRRRRDRDPTSITREMARYHL